MGCSVAERLLVSCQSAVAANGSLLCHRSVRVRSSVSRWSWEARPDSCLQSQIKLLRKGTGSPQAHWPKMNRYKDNMHKSTRKYNTCKETYTVLELMGKEAAGTILQACSKMQTKVSIQHLM